MSQPISGDPNADWLSSYGRNGKNRIRSYLERNGNCGRNGSCGSNGTTEFFYVCNVILTALTEFLRNFPYVNGERETAARQRKAGNRPSAMAHDIGLGCSHRQSMTLFA